MAQPRLPSALRRHTAILDPSLRLTQVFTLWPVIPWRLACSTYASRSLQAGVREEVWGQHSTKLAAQLVSFAHCHRLSWGTKCTHSSSCTTCTCAQHSNGGCCWCGLRLLC